MFKLQLNLEYIWPLFACLSNNQVYVAAIMNIVVVVTIGQMQYASNLQNNSYGVY